MEKLSTQGIEGIAIKNSMKEHITKENIIDWIVTKVSGLPNHDALKYNPELVLYVSSCIEIACRDNAVKTDKLDVFVQVYKKLYDVSPQDEVVLINTLEFVLKNSLVKIKSSFTFKSFLKLLMKMIPSVAM